MDETLDSVTTPRRVGDTTFVAEVPDGWQQGRGAFGGLVLALMVRAAEGVAAAPERRLRTLTAEICGPVVVGPVDIRVEALRIGTGTSTLAVRLLQGGEVQAHAVCILGRERDSPPWLGVPRPSPPPWRDVPATPHAFAAPTFTQHFEYRLTGSLPFAGIGKAHAQGWVRPRRPGVARDAALAVVLADAWWPALFGLMDAPRPVATITFTLDLAATFAGLDPASPLYHESTTIVSAGGYAPELRTLWGEDGRLVAVNHQTFVVIK
jgi:hypothetical protein